MITHDGKEVKNDLFKKIADKLGVKCHFWAHAIHNQMVF